jgi:hypothetical protein
VQANDRDSASAGAVPGREFVNVSLHASPPAAQLTIDGVAVSSNPLVARYPRDNQMHHVAASADGFDPKWRDIAFASDVNVDLALERHAGSAPPPVMRRYVAPPSSQARIVRQFPASPSSDSAAAASARADLTQKRTATRPIQTSNPYGAQ